MMPIFEQISNSFKILNFVLVVTFVMDMRHTQCPVYVIQHYSIQFIVNQSETGFELVYIHLFF